MHMDKKRDIYIKERKRYILRRTINKAISETKKGFCPCIESTPKRTTSIIIPKS